MDTKIVGLRIQKIRKQKGYTQEFLAEKAEMSSTYLGEVERGKKNLGLNLFANLVVALDVSADYLMSDILPSGKQYVYDDITKKLEKLTPKQRKTVSAIIDAYIANL